MEDGRQRAEVRKMRCNEDMHCGGEGERQREGERQQRQRTEERHKGEIEDSRPRTKV